MGLSGELHPGLTLAGLHVEVGTRGHGWIGHLTLRGGRRVAVPRPRAMAAGGQTHGCAGLLLDEGMAGAWQHTLTVRIKHTFSSSKHHHTKIANEREHSVGKLQKSIGVCVKTVSTTYSENTFLQRNKQAQAQHRNASGSWIQRGSHHCSFGSALVRWVASQCPYNHSY